MQGIDGTLVGQEESVQLVGRASAMPALTVACR